MGILERIAEIESEVWVNYDPISLKIIICLDGWNIFDKKSPFFMLSNLSLEEKFHGLDFNCWISILLMFIKLQPNKSSIQSNIIADLA